MQMWNLFRKKFKSETTEASYWSDIQEFCRITGKLFTKCGSEDVKRYYDRMCEQVKDGRLSRITLTKKFRELHSFASFLMENGDKEIPGASFICFISDGEWRISAGKRI